MKIHGLNFGEAMNKIIEDVSIEKINFSRPKIVHKEYIKPKINKIEYKRQLWLPEDIRYWSQYGINSEILSFYKVFSVKNVWLNDQLIYTWNKGDLCYAYEEGDGEIKIYFPTRTDRRFICNTSKLQGYNQLPRYGERLVITSSKKDVMTWHRLGIWSVAKQSENQLLTQVEWDDLAGRFEEIFVNLDDDLTGKKFSQKYKEIYGLEAFYVPEGKDISGYVKIKGLQKGLELVNGI